MFCPKCGDPVDAGEKFCNRCGYHLEEPQNSQSISVDNSNKKMIFIGAGVGFGVLLILFLIIVFNGGLGKKYFFNTEKNEEEVVVSEQSAKNKRGKYSTVIITDNTYTGVRINKDTDAYDLIVKDSVTQKSNCPTEIKKVEDEIISTYGITAVNLCELDVDFARELGNVFKKIYDEYPGARGYLTNLSLVNATMSNNYIAAFMPIFNFATSDSSTTYPWVIKTQVFLNTSYFLNKDRLEGAAKSSSASGHFPKNATIYSPLAHELGHYLSFLAMMKYYDIESILLIDGSNVDEFYELYDDFVKGEYSLDMITAAYENYKKNTNTTMTIDEWRGTISQYALAKDNEGNYIYDETIAESFHDVYLNGDDAAEASKYVVAVLKERLEG